MFLIGYGPQAVDEADFHLTIYSFLFVYQVKGGC